MEELNQKQIEILDRDYLIKLIIHLYDNGYKHENGSDHIQIIKDISRVIGHNNVGSFNIVRNYISVDTENKTYSAFCKFEKMDDFFVIKDNIKVVEKHGKKLKVKSHLNKRHQEHCLCFSGCKYFKLREADNCKIAEKLLQFNKDKGVTTPVWECIKYE